MQHVLERFQKAILDNHPSALQGDVKGHTASRLAIYIEGYRLRLIAALKADYPALHAVMGGTQFESAAKDYIERTPSHSYSLDSYPRGFAEFLTQVHQEKSVCDLAFLEQAIAQVFMGEESDPLDIAMLPALTPDQFAALALLPRASGKLLTLSYPLHGWLEAWRKGEKNALPQAREEHLYVYRHCNEVKREVLSTVQYSLVVKLFEGFVLEEALETVMAEHSSYQDELLSTINQNIPLWISKGFFKK